MVSKRSFGIAILLALFTVLVSSVMADDGRINRAPYHFGGDTLFCTQEDGCTLLDKTGHDLANWSQDAVATALAAADQSEQRRMVDGEGKGTYGPMQLWAMPNKNEDGNSTLCMVGFDEWGKQNDMCFEVTKDWHFEQAPLPVIGVDHSCDGLFIGERVQLISDSGVFGKITAIDLNNHTVTFGTSFTSFRTYTLGSVPVSHTAKCSEVEAGAPI